MVTISFDKHECGLSDEQQSNLAKLALGLHALPTNYDQFSMSDFCYNYVIGFTFRPNEAREALHGCQTCACALGHGPSFGILPDLHDTWESYGAKFIPYTEGGWLWCFGDAWENDPREAAKRIAFLLNGNTCTFIMHTLSNEVISPDYTDFTLNPVELKNFLLD